MRKKMTDEEKKPKISVTIDKVLLDILANHLDEKNVSRSKYIEKLIREDIKNKGFNVDPNF
jgi:metal-responsive CopG/Arc/MetJ family transcriptional regulator